MGFASLVATRRLLVAAAVLELGTGLALVDLPSTVATLLLGSWLDEAVSATVGRVAGVGLAALGLACWRGGGGESLDARTLVGAVLLYNAGVALVLADGGIRLGPGGIALSPTALLHAMMGSWCLAVWRRWRRRLPSA